MKYYKINKDVDVAGIVYDTIDNYKYVGSNEPLEYEELTYAQIKPVLDSCRFMRDYDLIITHVIEAKYSSEKINELLSLPEDNLERTIYERYVQGITDEVNRQKKEMGLITD